MLRVSERKFCAISFLLEVRGSVIAVLAGLAVCPGLRLLWMSKRSSHASTEYKRQWRSPLGNYEKVWWSRSLTSLSSSSQLDPAVGRPLFRIISLIFCSTVTFRETARRWRETHLAPVWAGWASMRTEKNTCGLNSTLQSPSDKAFFRI